MGRPSSLDGVTAVNRRKQKRDKLAAGQMKRKRKNRLKTTIFPPAARLADVLVVFLFAVKISLLLTCFPRHSMIRSTRCLIYPRGSVYLLRKMKVTSLHHPRNGRTESSYSSSRSVVFFIGRAKKVESQDYSMMRIQSEAQTVFPAAPTDSFSPFLRLWRLQPKWKTKTGKEGARKWI